MQGTTPSLGAEADGAGAEGERAIRLDAAADDISPLTEEAAAAVDTGDASAELQPAEAVVIAAPPPPPPVVGTRTLKDRSKYHGEVNESGEPHGVGVLDSCFGSTYAGEFCDGKKLGFGVQVYINGSTYAGEFVDDQPSGHGVHTSPFAERYMGEWLESARHGVGVCMESDSQLVCGRFADNELDEAAVVAWESVQEHMQRALVAERRALRSQEAARERHTQAIIEELSAVETTSFRDTEQIARFEAQEQLELELFVDEQSEVVAELERVADGYKFREAELKQHQKLLRIETDARAKELSLAAKFCALASERETQVGDAERTLQMLQTQLHILQLQRGDISE